MIYYAWSEQRPGWDPGTCNHEATLAGKPQSPEVRRKRNLDDKSHLTVHFGISRNNSGSQDLSAWMQRLGRTWAADVWPPSPPHPAVGRRQPAKGRQRSCAEERHLLTPTRNWPGPCRHKPWCAQQDQAIEKHLLFHAAGPSLAAAQSIPSQLHIAETPAQAAAPTGKLVQVSCCEASVLLQRRNTPRNNVSLILDHCSCFLLSHKLQIPKDAVHIFSESSLEKQSKIGSWQRTLLSSSSAPLLSVHLMLLAQKQNANTSEAGKSLLFSVSSSDAPSTTSQASLVLRQHPHPCAGCTRLNPGCSFPKQSQQREQTLRVCREIAAGFNCGYNVLNLEVIS